MSAFAHGAYNAGDYRRFRPDYPPALYDELLAFAGLKRGEVKPGSLVVDVACGTGQATLELSRHFSRVIGLDVSVPQIEQAKAAAAEAGVSNAEFLVSRAEELPSLPEASADVVTVAQAVHWFERPRFYKEAARVLKPGGTLALWSYDLIEITGPDPQTAERAQKVLKHFDDVTMGPYWEEGRKYVTERYASFELPADLYPSTHRALVHRPTAVTIRRLLQMLGTWSGLHRYRQQHPDPADDPLPGVQAALASAFGSDDLDAEYPARFSFFMLMGRRA
eukprot:tig00021312_g20057.t1